MHTLTFETLHHYDLREVGVSLPVQLRFGGQVVDIAAKVDTGADNCIFAREYGERLGIDIEQGTPQNFGTATGHFLGYGHELILDVLGVEFVSTVYFAQDEYFRRNVLGRIGWLDRIAFGLVDYEGKLYINPLW